MNSKAVIFDVDGVLLDTVPYHFEAWKKIFAEKGIILSFETYLSKVNGLPRMTGIKNILPHCKKNELVTLADKKQLFLMTLIAKNPPSALPGTVALLTKLRSKKICIAAASSSKNAPFLLNQAGLDIYMDVIVGGNDFKKSKPHPDLFLKAAEKLNVNPQNCIVIEDAAIGIQAGKNAGMKTIGILSSGDKDIKTFADITILSLKNSAPIFRLLKDS